MLTKTDWQIKKLGEICDFQNGFAFKSFEYTDSGFFVMRIGNVQDGYISLSDPKYIKKSYKPFEKFILKSGDILVSLTGNVGRIGVINEEHLPAVINQRVARIVLKNNESVNKQFFIFFLKSPYFIKELIGVGHGAAQQNISTKDIEDLEIPLPPLPEQQHIVKILDKIFEKVTRAKEIAEKNLQNSRELFKSYLQEIFTSSGKNWEEKKLSEVCEKITDGTHQTPTYYDDGTIFLSSRNVTSGKIDWENIKYIDDRQHLEMHKRVAPRRNDILLAKNGTTGVAAIVDKDVTFDIYVSLALLRALDVIIPSFLLYFVNSPVAKKQFNKRLKGSGVPNLHLEEIREVVIPFPKSLTEQKVIVKKLDELSAQTKKLEQIYRRKLGLLEGLKKSVLAKAFKGEL